VSGVLKAHAEEFAGLLGAGVSPFPPAKLSPPGFVSPGDPWLERGDRFGTFRIRLDALLLFKAVNNETATTTAADAVEAAAVALVASDWNLQTVTAPRPISIENDTGKYLAVLITATKPIGL
jgi:hypothetical protein